MKFAIFLKSSDHILAICVEAIVYCLLYNLHDCTFKRLKTNTAIHNAGPQGYPLLSANVGVSPLYGLIVASLRINQTYIKIDKVKIKP